MENINERYELHKCELKAIYELRESKDIIKLSVTGFKQFPLFARKVVEVETGDSLEWYVVDRYLGQYELAKAELTDSILKKELC